MKRTSFIASALGFGLLGKSLGKQTPNHSPITMSSIAYDFEDQNGRAMAINAARLYTWSIEEIKDFFLFSKLKLDPPNYKFLKVTRRVVECDIINSRIIDTRRIKEDTIIEPSHYKHLYFPCLGDPSCGWADLLQSKLGISKPVAKAICEAILKTSKPKSNGWFSLEQ